MHASLRWECAHERAKERNGSCGRSLFAEAGVECRTPEQSPVPELARVTSLAGISQRNAPFSERRSAKYPSGCTRVGSDMAHDEAIGVCGKGGRSIPAGVEIGRASCRERVCQYV